ncbi:MAG: hypothetical protein DRO23_06025 [Thermoprotei archaeon]|nr:MAG: hypothetical protein DRO23_06025 [Thermoprotei archaeon]
MNERYRISLISIISATLASALTAIGSEGVVYLGLIYVPLRGQYVAAIPYFFILLSLWIVYINALREKSRSIILATLACLIGFYFCLITTISAMSQNVFENYVSFCINSLFVTIGSSYLMYKYSVSKKMLSYFSNRDTIDKISVSIAFLVLGASRILVRSLYLPIPLSFLFLSWIVTFIILKSSPIMEANVMLNFELFMCSTTVFAWTNMVYLVLLRAIL